VRVKHTDGENQWDFGSFAGRLRWLKHQREREDGERRSWKWLAERVGASYDLVRAWGSGAASAQPQEDNVRRICEVFGASPAWLRYGVGAPYPDDPYPPPASGRYSEADGLVLEVTDIMGGIEKGEVVAEVVRRAVRRMFTPAQWRRIDKWRDSFLGNGGPQHAESAEPVESPR
jgi:hypothetical protein